VTMTENQWPADSAGTSLDQYGNAAPADASAEPETYVTTKAAARQEASEVAEQAAGAARSVAQTAKAEAGNVAAEAKSSAQGLLQQAKSGLGSQAGEQQRKAADGIRGISSQLRTMADAPEQQGVASDLVREVAGRASSAASWIEGAEPGTLLVQVQSFARRKPGTFLLLAAGAGILAGRLARSLQAGGPDAGGRPTPSQAPARGTTAPPWGAEPVYREQAPATYGETIYGEPARPSYSGTEAGGVPLKNPDDPYSDVRAAERQP
jgi:F0F1-type ATP synthase membrane subunit b/b'